VKKGKGFEFKFTHEWARRYAGKFVGVVSEKVIAVGKSRLAVFKKAEKVASPSAKVGVFYFPTKKDMLTVSIANFNIR